jgi:hypothetical protein
MTSATPKPRAGEHTETDEVNEQCAVIGGETIGNLRNNFAVMRQHARNLEAERDALRERERELARQFMRLYELCNSQGFLPQDAKMANAVTEARAALAKVQP